MPASAEAHAGTSDGGKEGCQTRFARRLAAARDEPPQYGDEGPLDCLPRLRMTLGARLAAAQGAAVGSGGDIDARLALAHSPETLLGEGVGALNPHPESRVADPGLFQVDR